MLSNKIALNFEEFLSTFFQNSIDHCLRRFFMKSFYSSFKFIFLLCHLTIVTNLNAGTLGILDKYLESDIVNESKKVIYLIRNEKFIKVEEYFNLLLKANPYSQNGYSVLSEVYKKVSENRYLDPYLDQWCKMPSAAYSAFLIRAKFYETTAWRIRGGEYAKWVDDKQWIGFKEYLNMAKKDLDNAYKKNPADPNIANTYISVIYTLGLPPKDAERWTKRSIELDPVSIEAHFKNINFLSPKWGGSWHELYAYAEWYSKNPAKGSLTPFLKSWVTKELIKALKQKVPGNEEERNHKIIKILKENNLWADLVESQNKYRTDFPESTSALRGLAKLARLQGRHKEALEYYNMAIKIDPDSPKTYRIRARYYWGKGELSLAIADYEKAAEIQPESIEIRNSLTGIYNRQGQYRLAIKHATKSILMDPRSESAYFERGFAYDSLREYHPAIEDYKKAIEITPRYRSAYHNLGMVYQNIQKHQEAIQYLKKANELEPGTKTHKRLAISYLRLNKFNEAIKHCEDSLKLNKSDPYTYNLLADSYAMKGDAKKAVEVVSNAIKLFPDLGHMYTIKGYFLEQLKEYDKALLSYKKALELSPNNHKPSIQRSMVELEKKMENNE